MFKKILIANRGDNAAGVAVEARVRATHVMLEPDCTARAARCERAEHHV
jgi:acetyl/propionyl-CoA carboxylase alpha subunit